MEGMILYNLEHLQIVIVMYRNTKHVNNNYPVVSVLFSCTKKTIKLFWRSSAPLFCSDITEHSINTNHH